MQGLALRRAFKAGQAAEEQLSTETDAQARVDLSLLQDYYAGPVGTYGDALLSHYSRAGQELRSAGFLADLFSPRNWVNSYKNPIIKAQSEKLSGDAGAKAIVGALKGAKEAASKTTLEQMIALFEQAGKFFAPTN